jgi:hypothetical protein
MRRATGFVFGLLLCRHRRFVSGFVRARPRARRVVSAPVASRTRCAQLFTTICATCALRSSSALAHILFSACRALNFHGISSPVFVSRLRCRPTRAGVCCLTNISDLPWQTVALVGDRLRLFACRLSRDYARIVHAAAAVFAHVPTAILDLANRVVRCRIHRSSPVRVSRVRFDYTINIPGIYRSVKPVLHFFHEFFSLLPRWRTGPRQLSCAVHVAPFPSTHESSQDRRENRPQAEMG